MFIKRFHTKIGRLRILCLLEGVSLLVLVGIAVPMKYGFQNPSLTKVMGPVHGALFLLFLLNTISAAIELKWKASKTGIILGSCFIPFGTFYVDYKFLKKIDTP